MKTLAELVSYAKANPGKLNYGSSGAGGLTHYSVELFQARSGIKVVHIPFKSGGPSTAAVEVKEIMGNAGADTVKTTHEQYSAQIVREIAQWKPLIQEIAERK